MERIGEVIAGRYHIKGVLGTGGMGTVYRAVQEPIGRGVAIKILHPDLAKDDTFVNRFHTEAKAASVLVNPNTVTIHDFGQTDDGTLFIAMEHLKGLSLADRLTRGALPWKQAVAIGVQVCRALSEAHRKGIVHRDLKPENIMLSAADDGSLLVKVLDFGIAKMLEIPGRNLTGVAVTQVGVIIGTPQYMSPEQSRGGEPLTASDLYALGIILFEEISGSVPFNDDEPIVTLSLHMRSPVPTLASPYGAVPFALSNLIGALLRKDPKSRPGPADEIGNTLKQIVGALSFPAEEVLSGSARRLRLAGEAPRDESFEGIDLTEALDATTQEEADDLSLTRPRRLPDYLRHSSDVISDEDPTILTELPGTPAHLDLESEDFDDETPPHESARHLFYPSGGVVEEELVNEGRRDGDSTILRPVAPNPAASPKPPPPPSVPKDVAPPPPMTPIPKKVVPPPTTPLSRSTQEDVEELEPVNQGRKRLVLVVALVLLVIGTGALTGVLLLARLPVDSRDQAPTSSHAGVTPAGASSALPAGEPTPILTPELPPEPVVTPLGTHLGDGSAAPATGDAGPAATEPVAHVDAAPGVVSDLAVPMTTVTLRTVPRGAKVYTREGLICEETPCEYDFPTGKAIRLRFERSDGLSKSRSIVPGEETSVRVRLTRRARPAPSSNPTPAAPAKIDDQIW